MPSKPKVPCRHPGCAALVPAGVKYCEKHKRLHPEDVRSAARRGYDSKWQRTRKKYLEAHPLCVRCLAEGRYVLAEVIDHKEPHRGDPKLFWDEGNWQALCKRCHDRKTMTEDRWMEYRY